jgi:hypothetical protein
LLNFGSDVILKMSFPSNGFFLGTSGSDVIFEVFESLAKKAFGSDVILKILGSLAKNAFGSDVILKILGSLAKKHSVAMSF